MTAPRFGVELGLGAGAFWDGIASHIRRIANVNGQITDGSTEGFLRGPAQQWIDDLRRLIEDYGFDTFIFWGEGDPDEQLHRFAEEVVPQVRELTDA